MTFTATTKDGKITIEGTWIDTFPASEAPAKLALFEDLRELPGYTQAADALRAAMGETA
ncbi:hypothetical protein [Loktanella sp. R86503]|uniref:hypothetical protein n=1 Tax=Loktanella sp. R86503 TaxID=3093847 RepID=UPI0036DB82C1